MSKLKWFVAGIALGAVAVKQINENPKARKALDDALATAKEFTTAVTEGFVERENEIKSGKSAAKSPARKPTAKRAPAKKTTSNRKPKTAAK